MPTSSCPSGRLSRKPDVLAIGLLVLAVGLLHGHGLTLGFFLDDNNHLELVRQNGLAGLARGNTFDWNHKIIRVWWAAEDTGWAYFRPLPVLLRLLGLDLFGLNPLPFHLSYLTLYTSVVLLLYALLRRLGMAVGSAFVAGLLFTLHPTHTQVSAWLASDVTVLTALWTLLGLWLMQASGEAGHCRARLLAGVFGCYGLALCSRESGLMLGPILVLFDLIRTGRTGGRRAWWLYLALLAEALLYLAVRSCLLENAPLPRPPYYHWPWEPGFTGWLPYKLLSDFLGVTLGTPLVPVAEVPWLKAHPGTTTAGLALAAGVIVWFLVPLRRSVVLWGLLGGMVLAAAPTVLCFSGAYNYFLISAGWAAVLALWCSRLIGTHRRRVCLTLGTLIVVYLGGCWASVWQFRAANYAEECVRGEVIATGAAKCPPNTRLFFLNLPLFATEIGPKLRLETGRTDLEVFALTYSPQPFLTRKPLVIAVENERTLLVRTKGQGWFSGAVGEGVHLNWFGASQHQLEVGPVTPLPPAGPLPFRVEVVEKDQGGVKALRFSFERPLADPHYRFFLGGPFRAAEPLSFSGPQTTVPSERLIVLNGRLRRMQGTLDLVLGAMERLP